MPEKRRQLQVRPQILNRRAEDMRRCTFAGESTKANDPAGGLNDSAVAGLNAGAMPDEQVLRGFHLECVAQPQPEDLRQAVTAKRLGCMRADFAEAARERALRAWDQMAEREEAEG